MKFQAFALIALSVVAFEGVASAQDKEKSSSTGSVQVMDFPDADKLPVVLGSSERSVVKSGPQITRQIIVRPRLHFVPELLKSIENI